MYSLFYIVPIHFTERYAHGIFAAGRAKCPNNKKRKEVES